MHNKLHDFGLGQEVAVKVTICGENVIKLLLFWAVDQSKEVGQ